MDRDDTLNTAGKEKVRKTEAVMDESVHLPMLTKDSLRRSGMIDKSEIAKKYTRVLFHVADDKFPELYPTADFEKQMVRKYFPSGRYFVRQRRPDGKLQKMKFRLSSPDYSPLAQDLCQKCVSHSAFLEVMRGGETQRAKEELVHMLAILTELEKRCCALIPQKVLLAAYGASLSLTG